MSSNFKNSFLSTFYGAVDDKNRLSIPSEFRNALPPEAERHLILTMGSANFLNAFPPDFYNMIFERADADNNEFATLSSLERDTFLVGMAHDRTIDNAGRITLPPKLLEQSGISREVVFMGRRTHFTIWGVKAWEEHLKSLKLTPGEAWQRLIDSKPKGSS